MLNILGRRALHAIALILWALLAVGEITGTPALTDRAFTLLIAGAVTATIAGVLVTIAAPWHAAYQLGVQSGRFAEQQGRLTEDAGDGGGRAPRP